MSPNSIILDAKVVSEVDFAVTKRGAVRKSASKGWGLSSWIVGPKALSGVLASSGWTAPRAVAASVDVGEERGATGNSRDCEGIRRTRSEAVSSLVFSVVTSATRWGHFWPRMGSVEDVVFANVPGCSREMGLGSLTLTGTVVPCAPRSRNACWAVIGGFWVSNAGELCSRSNSTSKVRDSESGCTWCCMVSTSDILSSALISSPNAIRSAKCELCSRSSERSCSIVMSASADSYC
jgi:hypothetical protein